MDARSLRGYRGLERVILGSCHKRVFKRRLPHSFVQTPSHLKEKPVKKTERGEKCLERQLIRWPCEGRQQSTWNWMLEGLYTTRLSELCRSRITCWGQCLAEEWRFWQILKVSWIRRYVRSLIITPICTHFRGQNRRLTVRLKRQHCSEDHTLNAVLVTTIDPHKT